MGEFSVLGSFLQLSGSWAQDRTCISGQTCSFDDLRGTGLSNDDHMWVLDTCASENGAVARFARDGRLSVASQSGASVSWGSVVVSAAGGEYRLCWCAGGLTCTTISNFRVDVGALTVIGPAPLSQDHTCVSGQTCAFDSLSGQLLSDADRLMVLETCGDGGLIHRFSDVGFVGSLKTSGSAVSWGSTPLTSAGGQYRLCWCAGVPGESVVMNEDGNSTITFSSVLPKSAAREYEALCSSNSSSSNETCTDTERQIGISCNRPEEFRVDLGEMRIMGPTPLTQARTCIAGLTCAVDGPLGMDIYPPILTSVLKVRIAQYGNGHNDVTRYQLAYNSHLYPGFGGFGPVVTCLPKTGTTAWQVCEFDGNNNTGFVVTQAKYWRVHIMEVEGGFGAYPMIREIQFYALLQNAEPQWIVPPGGASSVVNVDGTPPCKINL